MTTAVSRLVDSKWTAIHAKPPAGPGDHRPTAIDILTDESLIGRWTDKVILVTGASNGIGVETARALFATGAHLYLPVRDMKKGETVVQDIVSQSSSGGKGKIDLLHLDMNSLASVRQCAADFLAKSKQLNVLICNAGVMASPESRTVDGFETQFGIDHLAHFLLFELLKDTLIASSTAQFNSRVITVSSSMHLASPILFDDYDQSKQGYDKWRGYGQAKTANVYMANEIDRRYGERGLHALSVMPGNDNYSQIAFLHRLISRTASTHCSIFTLFIALRWHCYGPSNPCHSRGEGCMEQRPETCHVLEER